jgi:PPP family 3-phenylpropionic acid transporter
LVLFLAIWLISLSVPECHVSHAKHLPQHISHVLRQPSVIALLLVGLLMQAGHGAYYTFYSIYLEAHGYSRSFIGGMWALGVLAEVILFIYMHRLLKHYGAKLLLLSSLVLATIRWILIAFFIDNLAVLLFAQLLHAATFGSFHAASIHLIHYYFPGKLQARGQALYTSISFGLGSAIGTLSSGYMWEWSTTWTFMLASIASIIAVFITWVWIENEN